MSTADNLQQQSLAEEEYSYDVVPYPSHPFRQSHPERLASVGNLFGIKPADIHNCRVLEIGCAAGGNLIPMAEGLPDSKFVGVDLSKKQIERGQLNIDSLGLTNIELKYMNCVDIDESMGTFDYIIVHGVFSWIPEDVQERIFEICQKQLSENGIAYVSYNTYPGWHLRGMIRDMMNYHVRNLKDAPRRIQQSRALLEFLAKSVSADKGAYGMLLNNELQLLRRQSDNYLFHEHLEKDNTPIYFHEFIERAKAYDLQYLGESQLATMWIGNFPKDVAQTLERIAPDIVQREQYADFVRNRTFRQTLLCHKDAPVSRALKMESLEGAHVAGNLDEQIEKGKQPKPGDPRTFVNPLTRQTMTTQDPLVIETVMKLREAFPCAISFEDLFQHAMDKMVDGVIADATKIEALKRSLATNIIHMTVSGIVELQYNPSRYTADIPEFPKTSAVARMQAESTNRLTSCRHETVTVDDLSKHLVPLMDGTRTKDQLVAELKRLVDEGKLVIQQKGERPDSLSMDTVMDKAVDEVLSRVAKASLLVKQD
ncbi:methyltransferase regulatory domain-containing protein [Bremerella sp. T1]|uniref:methyltransferase regulatory domain-containing protein n=1 Tax=Bremerella sp. TYQ1 TaxID=3119568 RepID=UPI001CC9946F|nr:class I SAM-dependent methyltransferase [Bremerella volcania]UBM38834.1 class I SAM-dependent methyltransferase [Bremerella volcania]